MNEEGQSASNHGIGNVLHSLISFLCLGKMTPAKSKLAKCEVCSILQFLTAKHYSATAIYREICTVYGPVLYGEKFMIEKVNIDDNWISLFKSEQTNMNAGERRDTAGLIGHSSSIFVWPFLNKQTQLSITFCS